MVFQGEFLADSMAFIGAQGERPLFRDPRPEFSLAHLTSVPPFVTDISAAFTEHAKFVTAAMSNNGAWLVRNAEDLPRLGRDRVGFLFGMQHAPNGLTHKDVRLLATASVRSMSLAYYGETEYGGGFKGEGGLTSRGENLIEWMAEEGILLDLSHANCATARDALFFIRDRQLPMKPMASHSASHELFGHPRNFPHDVLRGIAELDGYVGIPLISFFLGPKEKHALTEFVLHVTYMQHLLGAGRVGIGSDAPHLDMTVETAQEQYKYLTGVLGTTGTFGEYFPDRPLEIIRRGSALFQIVKNALPEEGLRRDPGLLGGNFRAFLQRSLPKKS